MAVPSGSDFYRYAKFPEVYHGQGISKAAFSGGERPVTGKGRDTTSSVMVSWEYRYILCFCAAAHRRAESRSGTGIFRICGGEMRKQDMHSISICRASAYGRHTHMPVICICDTYTNQSGRHILHICTHTSCMISWRNIHAHSFDI